MTAFLILVALATVGNFASDPSVFQTRCAGSVLEICW